MYSIMLRETYPTYPTARSTAFYRSFSSAIRETQFLAVSGITLIHKRS